MTLALLAAVWIALIEYETVRFAEDRTRIRAHRQAAALHDTPGGSRALGRFSRRL